MRPIEIESWTLRIVTQVLRGQPNEDSLVELKAEFPEDISKAARQIAALANSSFGETVLWIIGVDEKGCVVKGVNAHEMSAWWSKIEAQFDELAPSFQNLAVNVGGTVVLALAFGTDRIPFVVKNPDGKGRITREVPWREGNKTETARRSQLVRLLGPSIRLPTLKILDASIVMRKEADGGFMTEASMVLYIIPRGDERVVFPDHDLALSVEQDGKTSAKLISVYTDFPTVGRGGTASQYTLVQSYSELIVNGPGKFTLRGIGHIYRPETFAPARLVASMLPALIDRPIVINAFLAYTNGDDTFHEWRLFALSDQEIL